MSKELNYTDMQISCLKDMYQKQLERDIRSLINTLEHELKSMEKAKEAGKKYSPNYCGIVQNAGRAIDESCIKLGTLNAVEFK